MSVCVGVCVCVRMYVRACVRACVCVCDVCYSFWTLLWAVSKICVHFSYVLLHVRHEVLSCMESIIVCVCLPFVCFGV